MAIDKHISGAVEKFEDTAGTSHSINAEYIGGYDAREVFPNYGEVKTLNRISNKGYTGSATWYYPLLKLPVDNAGNYASAIVTGRIGGWVASNMSFCQFLIWNRDGEGITCLHRDGKGSTSEATNTADLVVYRNSDNTTTVYIKCNSYFTYDLNVQTYQSNATIIYNGQYSTTAPTGTLKVSGANATTRLELSKNGAVYNGGALALKSDLTNYQPKGNYVTTDTAQTISAKKTFSSTPVLSTLKNKKVIGTGANGLIEAHTLGIDDITDLRSQLNGKQPSGAYAERQSAQTITGNWTFTGTTNFNGTTKVNGNEIASKGYVDGIFDSKLNASEATNFAKFTKFDNDTLKMTGARLYRTSVGDAVDRSSMYGYSSQNTHGTTYTLFTGMATIGSSQAFIGYYQYTKADGSGGDYIGNITLSNGRLARINGSLSSVNELTDAYAVLSDLNNKANKEHTHAISDVTNLQTSLNGKQATLVSGTNIRTINGNSILGGGNLSFTSLLTEKEFHDIMTATSSISSYIVMDKLLIQWGVYIGAYGDTISWEVTYPKEFWWYPAVILQTKDTITNNQGIPYSNGAVITDYNRGKSFIFQLRRSESCPVYWLAIGGLK